MLAALEKGGFVMVTRSADGEVVMDPMKAIAAVDAITSKLLTKTGESIGPRLDIQQKLMLFCTLKNSTIGMNVGTGKTYPNVQDFMVRRIMLGDAFRGRLICDAARSQYVNENEMDDAGNFQYEKDNKDNYVEVNGEKVKLRNVYYDMFKSVGLKPYDATNSFNDHTSPDAIALKYNDPSALIVVTSETQAHLVNQWKNSPDLKKAMLQGACITIDEFHETLQLRTAPGRRILLC